MAEPARRAPGHGHAQAVAVELGAHARKVRVIPELDAPLKVPAAVLPAVRDDVQDAPPSRGDRANTSRR